MYKINLFLSNTILMGVILFLTCFLMFVQSRPIVQDIEKNANLEAQKATLEGELKNTQEMLELIDNPQTQQFLAREQYLLSQKGEILFKLGSNESK